MKNKIIKYLIIGLLFMMIPLSGNSQQNVTNYIDHLNEPFSIAVTCAILFAILLMFGILIFYVVNEGKKNNEMGMRGLAVIIGLTIFVIIDSVPGLSLSNLLINSLYGVDLNNLKSISFISFSVVNFLVGIGLSLGLKAIVQKQPKVGMRLFMIIFTIAIFLLTKILFVSLKSENVVILLPSICFVIGYGLTILLAYDTILPEQK